MGARKLAAMDKELQEKIALFRFGLISPLVNRKGMSRGEQEAIIKDLVSKRWQIPGIAPHLGSPLDGLQWLSLYQDSGQRLESLQPQPRSDRGRCRALDSETEAALVQLRRELPEVSLPVLLKLARTRKIVASDFSPPKDSLYRLFKRHGLDKDRQVPADRRRFETELSNDMWQSDCLHGPKVIVEGKLRKSYLFAIIDDHSRLIPHAQFYLSENSGELPRLPAAGPGETRPAPQALHGQRQRFPQSPAEVRLRAAGHRAAAHPALFPRRPRQDREVLPHRAHAAAAPAAAIPDPGPAQRTACISGSRANTISGFTAPPARPRWNATSLRCPCCAPPPGTCAITSGSPSGARSTRTAR